MMDSVFRFALFAVAFLVIFSILRSQQKKRESRTRLPGSRTSTPTGEVTPWPPPQRSGAGARTVAASPRIAAPGAPAPKSVTLNLDAGAFAPISPEDARRQAGGIGFGGMWWGRRDLIPPADDKRTNLIDRGMVAQG